MLTLENFSKKEADKRRAVIKKEIQTKNVAKGKHFKRRSEAFFETDEAQQLLKNAYDSDSTLTKLKDVESKLIKSMYANYVKSELKKEERRKAEEEKVQKREQYYNYVCQHRDYFIQKINTNILRACESFRGEVAAFLHDEEIDDYEWRPEPEYGEYWDHSGHLKKIGIVDFNDCTLREFLEKYTGNWLATFESGCGKKWTTFGDGLSYETMRFADNILNKTVFNELIAVFDEIEPNSDWIDDIGGDEIFEELYDDTLAFDFFYSEGAMEHIAPDYLDKNISEFFALYHKNC